MIEYAAILAVMNGNIVTNLTNFVPASNPIVIVGGIIFFFWIVVFKLN